MHPGARVLDKGEDRAALVGDERVPDRHVDPGVPDPGRLHRHELAKVVGVERPAVHHLGAVGVDEAHARARLDPHRLAVPGRDPHQLSHFSSSMTGSEPLDSRTARVHDGSRQTTGDLIRFHARRSQAGRILRSVHPNIHPPRDPWSLARRARGHAADPTCGSIATRRGRSLPPIAGARPGTAGLERPPRSFGYARQRCAACENAAPPSTSILPASRRRRESGVRMVRFNPLTGADHPHGLPFAPPGRGIGVSPEWP